MLKDEAADRGPDEEPDLPRRARERHVPAEQLRLSEIDDERGVDGPVQALGQGEDADGDAEDDRRVRSGEPGASGHHAEECAGPHDPHQGETAQPPPAFDELHDGQLPDCDSGREHEPDQADPELADMRGVLRERRQQLAHHRDACADEDDVQDDVGQKDAIAHDVCVPARVAMLLAMTRRR
ncbi:MAG: hypothetical protein QOD85_2115 [Gaiellaceae bacterium]|nr:hypothetical protein [Gaiellaceae bacterium]